MQIQIFNSNNLINNQIILTVERLKKHLLNCTDDMIVTNNTALLNLEKNKLQPNYEPTDLDCANILNSNLDLLNNEEFNNFMQLFDPNGLIKPITREDLVDRLSLSERNANYKKYEYNRLKNEGLNVKAKKSFKVIYIFKNKYY